MTQDEDDENRTEPVGQPLESGDAARQVAHVTGMTEDSARTFASFHSGRYATFWRAA
jgi:hypothetical protein